MAEDQKQNLKEKGKPEVMSATRHVGPTLEAEGQFSNVMGTELPLDIPVGQAPDAGHPEGNPADLTDGLEIRTYGEDKGYQHFTSREDEALSEGNEVAALNPDGGTLRTLSQRLEERPERLKTRLPGDSSSDPHTDLNTDLGERPGEKRRAS